MMIALVAVLTAGCAGGPGPGAPGSTQAPTGQGSTASAPASSKTLRVAVHASAEPTEGIILLGSTGVVATEPLLTFHDGLTLYDADSNLMPRVAERVPTIENGDWKLLPDGGMEVTWRLRSGVTWHDGTALTAEDFVFGYTVRSDRELPVKAAFPTNLVSGVTAPDERTLVVRWTQPYIVATVSNPNDLPALPRHLLQALYEGGDKQAFAASPYWTREFVGLGPYRVGNWQLGSSLEAVAQDGYFLGKPKIDRVIYQYIGDPNAQIASLMSGASDMTPAGSSLGLEHMIPVKNTWEAAGHGTTMPVPRGVWYMTIQFRDPSAPWVRDLNVRRAIVHAIDRQAIVDSIHYGLTDVADTFVSLQDPLYTRVQQQGLTRYPYDPARSRQLLSEAGVASQRFTFNVAALGRSYFPKEAEAIAGQLTEVGIASSPVNITPGASNQNEIAGTVPGGYTFVTTFGPTALEALTTRRISSADTRWTGNNHGGYSNPTVDQLYARYQITLPEAERAGVMTDLLKTLADDVAAVPLYYTVQTVMFRKGIRGPGRVPPVGNHLASAWNIHTWEMD